MRLAMLVCIVFIALMLVGCQMPEALEEAPEELAKGLPEEMPGEMLEEPAEELPEEREELLRMEKEELSDVTISVVYDNNEYNPKLQTAWGFASVIQADNKTILFDTGGDSPALLANMLKLGLDPKDISAVVLSHIHSDHVGGLLGFLEQNPDVTVYLPASFPASFKNEIQAKGAGVVEVGAGRELFDGFYTTGELGTFLKEQSLIINTNQGIVIVTGCSHPGIVNIVRKAKELMNKEVHLVLGGFHLGGASDSVLKEIVNDFRLLGVEKVAPCHCTGDRAMQLFEEEYKQDYIKNGVGKKFEIK